MQKSVEDLKRGHKQKKKKLPVSFSLFFLSFSSWSSLFCLLLLFPVFLCWFLLSLFFFKFFFFFSSFFQGNWKIFKLIREAMIQGEMNSAKKLFPFILNSIQSEIFFFWISSLQSLCNSNQKNFYRSL